VLATCEDLKGSKRMRSEEEKLSWGFHCAEVELVVVGVGGDGDEIGTEWLL
jgi:hypothetical protein